MTSDVLDRLLNGAPADPDGGPALGVPTRAFYRDAVRHAREIRDRDTFLDLAADSGMLEP